MTNIRLPFVGQSPSISGNHPPISNLFIEAMRGRQDVLSSIRSGRTVLFRGPPHDQPTCHGSDRCCSIPHKQPYAPRP